MVFNKNHFQNRYVALETPSRPPPPLHGKCHLKFPFWFSAHLPNKRCRSWGTRSLSPQASELGPGLCPSCVPCYRHLLGFILMQNDSNLFTKKPPWWLLWWLSVCFFKWSLREKLFPQRPHLCFLSPVWILKCLCNSSDLNKRYFWKEWNFPKNILTWWISWHSRANCKDRAGPQCASAGELEGEKSSCRSFHSWDSGTGAW